MKSKMLAVAIALSACSLAHGATAFSFPNLNGVLTAGGEPISPYSGSLGGVPVTLFCDDFNDNVPIPANYNVNVTTVNSSDFSNTRFATTNYNVAYPAGTTLYQQMAWLFTQMMTSGQTQANQIGIQEAVWHMTSTTPAAVSTISLANTGSDLSYVQWIAAAQGDYNHSVNGYATPNYSNWMILTDVANATVKTVGTGNQELMAYYSAGGNSTVVGNTLAPEPGSIALFGIGLTALLAGARFRGRRGGSVAGADL